METREHFNNTLEKQARGGSTAGSQTPSLSEKVSEFLLTDPSVVTDLTLVRSLPFQQQPNLNMKPQLVVNRDCTNVCLEVC